MAGDWIKMREALHEDPAVLSMANGLATRPEHVVGYCHRFWSWVSRNCHDGTVTGVTLASLEGVLNLPGFLSMMQSVGWLTHEVRDGIDVITIPKFDRHLSQGAKTRGLNAERQRVARSSDVAKVSRSQRDESVTREEKRRTISLEREGDRPTVDFAYEQTEIDQTAWEASVPVFKGIVEDLGSPRMLPDDRADVIRGVLTAQRVLPAEKLESIRDSIRKKRRRDGFERPFGYLNGCFIKECENAGVDFHRAREAIVVPDKFLKR